VNKKDNPCVFYDITQGDNNGACQGEKQGNQLNNCYLPSADTYGVLSTSNGKDQPAYPGATGWDFATGIGSVNAFNLVTLWPALGVPTPTSGSTRQ
jgi:hypothetical protein